MFKKNKKGFTLIELLVVIAIIGILASVVLVSLNTARSKARDARRQADLKQIATAAEMFYNGTGLSEYPNTATAYSATNPSFGEYLVSNPMDPLSSQSYTWVANSTEKQKYKVCATLENPKTPVTYFYVSPSGSATQTTNPCTAL